MEQINTKYCTITYKDDLIRILFFKDNLIDLEETIEYSSIVERLVDGKPFASIAFAESGVNWTRKAREFLASCTYEKHYASAMVSDKRLLRLVANFYILISKPACPTRFFNALEDAEIWVKKLKEQYYSAKTEEVTSDVRENV